jgi:hypothetical protein
MEYYAEVLVWIGVDLLPEIIEHLEMYRDCRLGQRAAPFRRHVQSPFRTAREVGYAQAAILRGVSRETLHLGPGLRAIPNDAALWP